MSLPGAIAFCNDLSIGFDIADEFRQIAPWGFVETPDFGGLAVVPAVSELDDDRVFAFFQKFRHIVCDIGDTFIELRDDRGEDAVIRLFAVDIEHMPSESAEIDCCRFRLLFADKCFSEIRRRE